MTTETAVGGPSAVPASDRGATRIADRVIAKIASQAAREALRQAVAPEWLPAVRATPHATVAVRRAKGPGADEARVHVAVELGYPADIGAQCGAVRRHVTERVRDLSGMAVPEVAVSVERLHSASTRFAGQGRVR
ncbi:hypothetical protein [Streptomyces sp. URMC 123]|uniref:hypothetical protein n=1 Tax=Streptomyces sp. URMC 123 TaxID=3423403 RepID=UPI003F1BFB16